MSLEYARFGTSSSSALASANAVPREKERRGAYEVTRTGLRRLGGNRRQVMDALEFEGHVVLHEFVAPDIGYCPAG